jgi:hypothetical protein
MRVGRIRVAAVVGVLALAAAPTQLGAAPMRERVREVAFEVERSPGAQATYAACAEVIRALAQRGWDTGRVRVRIQSNPFDATASPADVILGAGEPSDDSAFVLATAIVERQLRRNADPSTARVLAQSVAAHLSPPGTASRLRWELSWLARLGQGEIVTTALPEALWRTGADAAVRLASQGGWPDSGMAALVAYGVEEPLRVVGEIALAGLLDPENLGFHGSAATDLATSITQRESTVRFPSAGVRIVAFPADVSAVAVLPIQSERAEAWVAVRYPLTGGFDAVPLSPRAEVAVPLRGLAWAGVVVVALDDESSMSLAVRPLTDYPVRIKRWDFLAGDQTVTLTWETEHHDGLRAFVVEALQADASTSWSVLRRTIVPVAENGEGSFGYAFVDEASDEVAAYRLLALTADGFLAEVGSFPLRGKP